MSQQAESINPFPFLLGGGEMGALTRQYNWASSPIGTPDQWPQSLRTTVSTILSARFPMFLWWGPQQIQFYNDAYRPSLGDQGKHPTALGQPGVECWPEIWSTIKPLIDQVLGGGESVWLEDQRIPIVRNGQLEDVYWTFSYSPVQDDTGQVAGVLVVCQETTRQVIDRQRQQDRFRSIVEQVPVATCLFVGPDLRIEIVNQPMIDYFGQGPSIVGQPVRAVLRGSDAELAAIALLEQVFTSGQPFQAQAAPAELTIDGVTGTYYFDFSLKPLRYSTGEIYAILETAVDVTQQVLARQKLENSELFSRSIFDHSPVAKIVFVGHEMIIERVNQIMLTLLGRDASIIGKPFMEAMPELVGTPLLNRLRHVLTTGETYYQPEEKLDLIRFNQPYTGYYSYIYKALSNATGERYGIVFTATEVTTQVVARQQLEEVQSSLAGAIELAELGTWHLDLASGILDYSPRLRTWLGIGDDESITIERAYEAIALEDRPKVKASMVAALAPGSNNVYDVEYRVKAIQAGKGRILRAQGKTFRNSAGEAYKVSGTVQDVTRQRKLQLALEQQVQERTEELEATNEELAATNEELIESNTLLLRSNDHLQTFAYVASHDLQEPLRKIQQFGDLLRARQTALSGDELAYIERMQAAARRMSTLIRDLLNFSRISTQRETDTLVPLNGIVEQVLVTFDLVIAETNAEVSVAPLPTVQGNATQLTQLFQNLIGNALKFHRPEVAPVIDINMHTLETGELPFSVKPARAAKVYYRIDVADNGVGFDEKYLDRIFQVFQRLHGKSEFAGTGIGLAICERVVSNHGGAITASSQPGQGAVFSVYLPMISGKA